VRRVGPRAATRPFAGTAAATAFVGVLLLGPGTATASPDGPPQGGDPQSVGIQVDVSGVTSQSRVEVDARDVVVGGAVTVRGAGLVPLTPYDLHLHSAYAAPVRLATVISLADGTFELSTLLPETVAPGTHFVRVTDPVTGVHLDTAEFEVGAAPALPGGSTGETTPPGPGTGNEDDGGLAPTGPLEPEPVPAGDGRVEAEGPDGLAFTGTTLAVTLAAAGALAVTGAVLTTTAARRRRARTS
jgi:hypothetical protein